MNFILQNSKQMPFYTDLRLVFEALGHRQKDFNWLITDLEYVQGAIRGVADGGKPELPADIGKNHYPTNALDKEKIWISGDELSNLVYGNCIQFIWGVLSGFEKDIVIDPNNLSVEPYADGNPNFWIPDPQIQHPLATVEIVCWDSTLALLLSKDEDISQRFQRFFTDAVNLNDYNKTF